MISEAVSIPESVHEHRRPFWAAWIRVYSWGALKCLSTAQPPQEVTSTRPLSGTATQSQKNLLNESVFCASFTECPLQRNYPRGSGTIQSTRGRVGWGVLYNKVVP